MVSTQPKFEVSFKELAVLSIQRQERGHVLMILNDTTSEIDKVTYRTLGDVTKADYTTANYERLVLAFMGNPYKVTVVKAESELSDLQAKLNYFDNYTLCYPEATNEHVTALINYLEAVRKKNNYSRAIFGNATAPDKKYIINFCTNEAQDKIKARILGAEKELSAGDYTCRIAGALCGLATNRSLTYFELPEIIDVPLFVNADVPVAEGKLVILHQDGSFKFGRAVNSLTTLSEGVSEAFQKIRIVETMDIIANEIISTFRKYYVGKYINNYANKLRFCNAVNAYLLELANEGLLEIANDNAVKVSYEKNKLYLQSKGVDVSKMTVEEIERANTGSKVLLDGVCSPTDAMEDLDLGMYLYQEMEIGE